MPAVRQYLWRLSPLSAAGSLMMIAALLLPIVGAVIAVQRPTRKRETCVRAELDVGHDRVEDHESRGITRRPGGAQRSP
jgi:hypothetical protein